MDAVGRAVAAARRVARVTSDQNVTFLAAGVAYYAFVSVLPAAVLALVVAVAVGGDRLATAVLEASAGVLTETGQQVVIDALVAGAGQGSVTLISLPLTLWGALKVLRGLDIAFSTVYGAEGPDGLLDQIRNALLVVASVGGGLLAVVAVAGVVAALDVGVVAELAGLIALPVVLTTAFLPMYYVFPGTDVTVREALPGAVFAGGGWTLLGAGFQAYVDLQAAGDGGQAAVYGTLGGILLFVTFLYFGATLVLVGAVVNVVLGADEPGGDPADDGDDPTESTGETGNIKGRTRVRRDE
ncbi:YihY family inner membrane protein [Halobaculum gomorrense]|uniref:YihY family inner membrane protein n=1 Tax=Halobaculum gomorrense TaxID=43928 RepID=A0A1M5QIV8_9EURY|nr:YihY family inner membrane protein [Halobaculum gomorrense]